MGLKREDVEFLPCTKIFFANERLVKIFVIVNAVVCRNLDLSIRARNEVHVLARRQRHLKLFDERRHVIVGNNGTLPLFDTHNRVGHFDLHVALNLTLASEAPMILDLLACEVRLLRVKNLTTSLKHLNLTLSTASLAATC